MNQNPTTLQLHQTVYASLFAALIAAGAFLAIPIGPVPIVLQNMFVLLAGLLLGPRWGVAGVGIFSAIQQVAKTTAFRVAEASLLAPCTYSAIIWATLTGWLFWRELPTISVVAGTAVVVGSNLAIAWRERRR